MIWLGATILFQIVCIVHAIRNGRNQMWVLAIFFFPLVGSVAYVLVEVLPGSGTNRVVRTARAKVGALVDPEKRLRTAHSALDLVDTAANRMEIGDAFAELGRYSDAVPHYREALTKGAARDPATQVKLSRALFETGDSSGALGSIEGLAPASGIGENDRRNLLRARILDHLGRKSEAEDIYADIVTRLPGEEARCRYAALLLERSARREAQRVLEEVEARMKRLDRTQRLAEREMYDWAMRELGKLRAA